MWRPHFVCPDCGSALAGTDLVKTCADCGTQFVNSGGIWRFLSSAREGALIPFLRQYRSVREQEGRRALTEAGYRSLPAVAPSDPHAREWAIRRETYHHLLRHVLASGSQPSVVLDLGAGNGWLSHRLSLLGHRVVAVDVADDAADGLGVVGRYPAPIVAIQADFDALPLASAQFDLVLFNGSLHYAPNPSATLAAARRLLRHDGTLVVMDSPMFHADVDGVAMLAETVQRFADDYGLQNSIRQGLGYLTFALLAASADEMRLESAFVPSRGSLAWRLRRHLAWLRNGRAPATFGLWVAR